MASRLTRKRIADAARSPMHGTKPEPKVVVSALDSMATRLKDKMAQLSDAPRDDEYYRSCVKAMFADVDAAKDLMRERGVPS